ncbi:hypothetical protein SKAU_G00110390 [Synaphobranchus kaupii]|uniref:Uncharacterized protein n=1 Tax=Synaphobranchus kaupii TaxID=118154 RepID=A0A9Q1J8A1_SYNKA|nr:hypothetical protein SKAU_G00110390 [Synaphobranchus kaupii]
MDPQAEWSVWRNVGRRQWGRRFSPQRTDISVSCLRRRREERPPYLGDSVRVSGSPWITSTCRLSELSCRISEGISGAPGYRALLLFHCRKETAGF